MTSPEIEGHSGSDETAPLLASIVAGPIMQEDEVNAALLAPANGTVNQEQESEDDGPFPTLQVFFLCYARLVEPIAFFSVFAFVNKMIEETGDVREEDVGFYSGLIESLFSLTQMTVMFLWGRASDRIGRKPVLVFSLAGVSCSITLFGFSTQLWQMVVFRCLAGVFAGSVVTIRTMLSENSTKNTQPRIFSYFTVAANTGTFIGPFIGGLLSNPADQYPSIFGGVWLFETYPYALATMVTGAIGASATITSFIFIEETFNNDSHKSSAKAKSITTWQLIKSPGVAQVLYIYAYNTVLGLAYTAVLPVFWFTSPSLGGFGFSPLQIATFLGCAGFSQAIWTLLVYTPLHKRIGSTGILRFCGILWPTLFLIWPTCNILLRFEWVAVFWTVAPLIQVFGSSIGLAYTATQLALNEISPSHHTLGRLNGIALTMVSGIRAITPALFTSIFAVGVKHQVVYGQLVWLVLFVLGIGLAISTRWLPNNNDRKQEDHISSDAEQS